MASFTRPERPAVLANERHEEWLLDDAIDDTFPASDPVATGQPGSIVNMRYAEQDSTRRGRARRASALARWWVPVSVVACALLLVRQARRDRDTPR
jgi:hypothetical protein